VVLCFHKKGSETYLICSNLRFSVLCIDWVLSVVSGGIERIYQCFEILSFLSKSLFILKREFQSFFSPFPFSPIGKVFLFIF